jgi:hypothetical protein
MARPSYSVLCNRFEVMAVCDDLEHAGMIVHALMIARSGEEDWYDYWVRDEHGDEYYHDAAYRTVFSASCFPQAEAA